MSPQKIALIVIIVIGGILVLGSYFLSVRTYPGNVNDFWGKISETPKKLYIASMLASVVSYFVFTYLVLFKLDTEIKIANIFGYNIFILIYLLILTPSASWMPLTFAMIGSSGQALWILIRIVLFLVGIGSLLLLLSLLFVSPRPSGVLYILAIIGAALFFINTGILDAFIWPVLFGPKW